MEKREALPYGYCGMPCALCSRYRTHGKSRCAGCTADGYYTEPCKVHRCCPEKGLAHCGTCAEFPCKKLGNMGDFRDLNTGHAKERTCKSVRESGFAPWYSAYAERAALLTTALARYNNGRMKRYLCELFLQQEVEVLREIMRRAAALSGTPRENGPAFQALAAAVLCAQDAPHIP